MPNRETGFAKLNLALHVRGRAIDGYHRIETLFAFCTDGDLLDWEDEPGLRVTGPFADSLTGPAEDNLVLRAQRAFATRFGCGGEGGFRLDKRLPIASGIGGGSADAAAALRLLCRRSGVDPASPSVRALAAGLGADVPACVASWPLRGTARGDRLEPLNGIPSDTPALLVNPGVPLATGPVFADWDGIDLGSLAEGDALAAARAGRNDLTPSARMLVPEIGDVLSLLAAQPGATLVRMSGSGATCFAFFDDVARRDAANRAVAAVRPGWWRLATRLR